MSFSAPQLTEIRFFRVFFVVGTITSRMGLVQVCRVGFVPFSFPYRPFRWSPALTFNVGHYPGGTAIDHSSTADFSSFIQTCRRFCGALDLGQELCLLC